MATTFGSKPRRLTFAGVKSLVYYVRVRENGRRSWRSTGQRTLKLATDVLDTWRVREAKGERYTEDLTLEEAVDRWYAAKEARVASSTLKVYVVYKRHWKKRFGRKPLRSIDAGHVETYLQARKRLGLKATSLNDERGLLRSFFLFCERQGWLLRNPMATVDGFQAEVRKPRALNADETERLLVEAKAAGEQTHAFVNALVLTGFRTATVRQLAWDHVDFLEGEWKLPAAVMKSRETFSAPIAPELLAWLKANRKPGGLIFGKLDRARFTAAAERAALGGLKPHDLRRTFFTRLRRLGVDLETAMALTDHRDVRVALECYRAVERQDLREALKKAFGGGA